MSLFAAWPSTRIQARVYGSEAMLPECRFDQSIAHKKSTTPGNDRYVESINCQKCREYV